MENIKKQKVILIKRINNLSDKIVHAMELLEIISRDDLDDDSYDDSDDDLPQTDHNIIKAFKKIFNDNPLKRSIETDSNSCDSDDIELVE